MAPQISWDPRVGTDVIRILYTGGRHERIGGRYYLVPPMDPSARQVVRNLYAILRPFAHARGLGQVYLNPVDFVLGSDDVIQPDLVFIRTEHVSTERLRLRAWAPDLIIKAIMPQERDLALAKVRLCETYLIPDYWLVDPVQQQIEVLRLTSSGNLESTTLRRHLNDTLVCSQPQGLQIPLAEVFD
ncbi:MAG TPA: Uma2 family endonuclease [Candidatus Methylomirabilis sp.]|nr:Uma2 family endonuclease [Candidatus Methylomirabilis sp.]